MCYTSGMKTKNHRIDLNEVEAFAKRAHEGQERKYTFEPYVSHPIAVAAIVAEYGGDDDMIAAALMHDVIEDTDHSLNEVEKVGGIVAAVFVEWLSNNEYPEAKNRKERKALIAAYLAEAPDEVKTIKLADIMHNTPTILVHDPKFAATYVPENKILLRALKGGDERLYKKVEDMLYG